RSRQRIGCRGERSRGYHKLFDRIRLVLPLLSRVGAWGFGDRYGYLFFARQLGFARRLLHLVAATAAAPARTGLTQPDDRIRVDQRKFGGDRRGMATEPYEKVADQDHGHMH